MIDTAASLRRKIDSAVDLQAVVRTMKAMAAASIGQYEKSVRALDAYYHAVEMGLGACFRVSGMSPLLAEPANLAQTKVAVVFGSDQGLVGRFNDQVADYAIQALQAMPGELVLFAVGERIHARLVEAGLVPLGLFALPDSVGGITPLVGHILLSSEAHLAGGAAELHLFYNHPLAAPGYEPSHQQLLPLDASWRHRLLELRWPPGRLPEIVGGTATTLRALIREYLFVSLFRACAESLASENASRLAAMQRADQNIDELLVDFNANFHRLRQSAIDEELFDVVSGFEALTLIPHAIQRR